MRKSMLFLMVLLNAGLAYGQIYSWRDAAGGMHYSDQAPIDADAKKLNTASPAAADDTAAAARKSLAEKESDFKKRQADAGEVAKKQQQADEKIANCAQARGNLRALESGQMRYKVDVNGEPVALEGDRLEAELTRARAVADSWCK